MSKMQAIHSIALLALATACSKGGAPAKEPDDDVEVTGQPVLDVQPGEDPPNPANPNLPARPELTAAECAAQGGDVIGDIGDGAIYQEAYMCPSGERPSGNIVPSDDAPAAVEGAVCCP